jgi:Tol biopolymer transport system component
MTRERWERLAPLVDALLDLPPGQRAAYIIDVAAGDSALASDLASFARADEADTRDTVLAAAEHERDLLASSTDRYDNLLAQLREELAGTYRVEREIGGGMSRVFRAQEIGLGRTVVIKILPPGLMHGARAEQFAREIRLSASLQQANIVPVLTAGSAAGTLFYAMPFVEGRSLRDRLRRHGALPVREAIGILRDIARALAYAHERGVIHCDIKPDNILLSGRTAVVTDFGIARALADGGGVAAGTPPYMAPEQVARSATMDHRADIYAFGCVAYEMLTGNRPDAADARLPLPAGVPAAVSALVASCLDRDPARRPASAAELLAALDRASNERRGTIVVAATVVGVAALALAATMAGRRSTTGVGASFPVTSDAGLQIEPALSPDGKLVAYARGTAGHMRISVQEVKGRRWDLTGDSTANELVPRWSPNGSEVLYLARNHALVAPARGGAPRVVVRGVDNSHSITSASWSPRGDSVVFVRNDSLMVQSVLGTGARFVGTGSQLHSCVWSGDGVWIACVTGNWVSFVPGPLFGNRAPSGVLLFRATGGPAITLADTTHEHASPSWSADSRELWVVSDRDGGPGEAYAIAVKRDGRADSAPRKVGLAAQWISLSGTRMVYQRAERTANIWSLPLPVRQQRRVLSADNAKQETTGKRIIEIVTVSPDGRWLVYDSNGGGNSDIYRLPIVSPASPPERLTDGAANEFVGSISPDGQYLAWHVTGGVRALRVKRLADSVVESPFPSSVDQNSARWSPDGQSLAAWVNEGDGPGSIFMLRRRAQGGWTRRWQMSGGQLPVWSPDGSELAFVTKLGEVMLIPADSGATRTVYRPRPQTNDPMATNVVWRGARDAHLWFIGNTPQGDGGIWELSLQQGSATQVVSLTTSRGTGYGPVFDTDGTRFYFVLDERYANVWYADLVAR